MRTSGERAFPSLEVLGYLGHLDIGVKLLDLIEDRVLVIVLEVVEGLLLCLRVNGRITRVVYGHALGLGAEPTMALSCPRVMESRPTWEPLLALSWDCEDMYGGS